MEPFRGNEELEIRWRRFLFPIQKLKDALKIRLGIGGVLRSF